IASAGSARSCIRACTPRPRKMPRLAAIMINWNGGPLAVESALSVVGQSVRPELWVVDNASHDGSAEAIARACPSVNMIHNACNLGFAAPNNKALPEVAEADYVLLVNNDVVLPQPDGLREVIAFLETNADVHGACGRYEFPDGEFQHFYNQLPTAFDLMVTWGF